MQHRCRAGILVASLAVAGLAGGAGEARAQADVLPGSERPELPPFPEEEAEPERLELPPLPPAEEDGTLSAGLRLFVRAFRVEGATAFDEEELAQLVAPWTGRFVASEDLIRVRDAITRHYVERGYRTSGAVIPDQTIESGVVTIRVVEGELASIEVTGTERFRPGYFRTRLRRAGRAPVNVARIEAALQRLQRDPRVKRVSARLEPGARRGESVLRLEVEENRFYGLDLAFSNESSPSIGGYTGTAAPVLSNLAGWGDEWRGEVAFADGLTEGEASVSVPLPPFDTELEGHFQYSENQVVEDPFDVLDIENESLTYGVTLRQPLVRDRLQELGLGLVGELRRSETRLAGECFSFVEGTDDCESRATVIRLFGDWVRATRTDVVAARATFSVGVDLFGATQRSGDVADGRFFAWLGQLQWAHRLSPRLLESQLLFRVDSQLAADPLLGIEKFAVGGLRTVRGYRENQLVRDNGVVTSLELRVPVWRDPRGRALVEIASFVDYGRSWNDGESGSAEQPWSAGIGLRVSPWEWLRGELYWGHPFASIDDAGGDLQDEGIHFSLTLRAL